MKTKSVPNNEKTNIPQNIKRQKGITLVALVISIILMLILAGIALYLTIRRKWII